MCRHRKAEKIRIEFINISAQRVDNSWMMWDDIMNQLLSNRKFLSFPKYPSISSKDFFFHLKSWVVSCIEQQWHGWKKRKKISSREGDLCCAMMFFSCLWKAKKKRKKKLTFEENNFSDSLPRENYYEKKNSFHLKNTPANNFMRIF